jgi:hypothetical protein
MRSSIIAMSVALLIAGTIFSTAGAGDDKKDIKPTQRWEGRVNDKEKLKAAPKAGFLTTQDAFEKLWDAWSVKGKAPKLDFSKQIVFVQIAGGPNYLGTTYKLDKEGNLTAKSAQTLIEGAGFGYGIDVLERAGIKSYQGKPLE